MDPARLKKACEGKSASQGGMNVDELMNHAKNKGYTGSKARQPLLDFLCRDTAPGRPHVTPSASSAPSAPSAPAKALPVVVPPITMSASSNADAQINTILNSKGTGKFFRGVTFSNLNLDGMNLSEVSLNGAILDGVSFKGANLSGAKMHLVKIKNCNFQSANLSSVRLRTMEVSNTDFSGVDLRNCDFSLAVIDNVKFIDTKLDQTSFEAAKISNTDFSQASLHKADLIDATIKDTIMSHSIMTDVVAENAKFKNVTVIKADLSKIKLHYAKITNSDFSQTSFDSARLDDLTVNKTNMSGANFNKADLQAASIKDSNFGGAVFTDSILSESNIDNTDLSNAILRINKLNNATLYNVNIKGANLTGSDFKTSDLKGQISWDQHTRFGDSLTDDQQLQIGLGPEFQTVQMFESRRAATIKETAELRDSCTFSEVDRVPSIPGMNNLIAKVESMCRYQMLKSKAGLLTSWFHSKYRNNIYGYTAVTLKGYDDGSPSNQEIFEQLANLPLTEDTFSFKLGNNSITSDYGGVSRDVFTRAGDYINSIMSREGSSRLYFNKDLPSTFPTQLAHVVRLSIMQGLPLGTPFSYGILYMMQTGFLTIDQIELDTLMYLYNLDHHKDFMLAINYINDDSLEYLQDMQITGYADVKPGGITKDDRMYWLKRYLYTKIVGWHVGLKSYLKPLSEDGPQNLAQLYIKTAGLSELAEVVGTPITKESVIALIRRSKFTITAIITGDVINNYREMLIKYINESDTDTSRKLMIFITGSPDIGKSLVLTVNIIATSITRKERKIPVAHSCSNTLELFYYKDYNDFKQAMNTALEYYQTFSIL